MRAGSVALGGMFLAVLAGPPEAHRNVAFASIRSLESDRAVVDVRFNPKELTVDKSVPWQTSVDSSEDVPVAEYPGPEPTRLRLELSFEDKSDVRRPLALLENLAREDQKLHRPPRVLFQWGELKFEGVIESLSQRYTMFLSDGTPVRAVADVRLREADEVSVARRCRSDADCRDGQVCVQGACRNP